MPLLRELSATLEPWSIPTRNMERSRSRARDPTTSADRTSVASAVDNSGTETSRVRGDRSSSSIYLGSAPLTDRISYREFSSRSLSGPLPSSRETFQNAVICFQLSYDQLLAALPTVVTLPADMMVVHSVKYIELDCYTTSALSKIVSKHVERFTAHQIPHSQIGLKIVNNQIFPSLMPLYD
eukprot:s1658_g7.t1